MLIIKFYVCSTLLYRVETCPLNIQLEKKIRYWRCGYTEEQVDYLESKTLKCRGIGKAGKLKRAGN